MARVYKVQVNVNLPLDIIQKIDQEADSRGITRTEVITDIINKALKQGGDN